MNPIQIALALAQFAPSILRFFGAGGASAAVAEKVAGIAQVVAGAGTPQEAIEAIRASGELQLKFQQRVLELDSDLEGLYLQDRQSARTRDIEVRKISGGSNSRADLMIMLAVIGMVACLVTLVFFRGQIPGEVVGIVSTVAGIFGACLRDAFQFEFGSSRGSRDKDTVLANMQQGQGRTP